MTIVSTPADRARQQQTLFAQQRANQVRDLIVADELNWDGYNAAHTAYLKELETYRSNPCPATFDRLRSAVDGVQRSFGRLLETSQAANEIERILVAYYNPTGPAQEAQ